ncbi:FAD-dependent oxidoreductase [Vibrio sp. SCSIO 43137]|uniref:FAD-dependent oxidoreductase n=1 Tax=Vibrio sp. SCSIO 43137 TaxID=3021011 RepID=UPI0023082F52|nr:FAD-dependent oxidoreductase [Vibrio sp. SCSIO 43137]WCE29150.1 FAD-dependent oxidoreductase [Vibrio sp. SCSIO 43137]
MDIYSYDSQRQLNRKEHAFDVIVAGGGLAGVCAAISAARNGQSVALIQDRPVLGGNASSEVRLWALGATSHMGNNNRFAREGGLMGEILEENLFRNKEGNPVIFDMILLDMVKKEKNIHIFLNTAVFEVNCEDETSGRSIHSVSAFNAINETQYQLIGNMFCDCTGDGIIGFLAGASHRIGAENSEEFDERMAPDENFGQKLGHSIYFYTKHVGEPVNFIPPEFALKDIKQIPRYKRLSSNLNGCDLWWLEWGGRLDTIRDSETIKWELWKIVWGVWDYIKNSGEFPDAANMTLEWVGLIPGKRESRRFIGDYMLTQKDIINQYDHYDAISFGGWSIDLHPADGVYSKHDGCRQFHSKGIYTIPYRTMYSKDIRNLFLGGRTLSATHVAFGSTRVMCTCGLNGQVIGEAASLAIQNGVAPAALAEKGNIHQLQQQLMAKGNFIPRLVSTEHLSGKVSASSTLALKQVEQNVGYRQLSESQALMLPLKAGESLPEIRLSVKAGTQTTLKARLLTATKTHNHTPELVNAGQDCTIEQGISECTLCLDYTATKDQYVFVKLEQNMDLAVATTDTEYPAILTVYNTVNAKVAKHARQIADGDWGVDEFEFWLPKRRPNKFLAAFSLDRALQAYSADYVIDGHLRPSNHSHGWVPDSNDANPELTLTLDSPSKLSRITLMFDNDFDHAMETAQWGHSENVSPNCVKDYDIYLNNKLYKQVTENHQSTNILDIDRNEVIESVRIEIKATHGGLACLYALHCQ